VTADATTSWAVSSARRGPESGPAPAADGAAYPDPAGEQDVAGVAAAGADTAVTGLFRQHYTPLLRAAVVLLGDAGAAEEVVQDAFLAVHEHWPRIRDKHDPAGYLYRSVVNGARSRLRRRSVAERVRRQRRADVASAEDAALAAMIPGPLMTAIRQLPRREREAVLVRHYLDLSEQQAADVLGVRPGSIKGYASRGLATLRRVLDETGPDGATEGRTP
jgi:RNA polymerase sigma-70 factor (sigma-E family)